MNDIIAWLVAFALIIGAFWALTYDYQQKQTRTV
ncbi:MAG: hypothetical protein FD167_1500, partial [bacterium]